MDLYHSIVESLSVPLSNSSNKTSLYRWQTANSKNLAPRSQGRKNDVFEISHP